MTLLKKLYSIRPLAHLATRGDATRVDKLFPFPLPQVTVCMSFVYWDMYDLSAHSVDTLLATPSNTIPDARSCKVSQIVAHCIFGATHVLFYEPENVRKTYTLLEVESAMGINSLRYRSLLNIVCRKNNEF